MSAGFLRSWVATHVRVVKAVERSLQAKSLAAICATDAIEAGVDLSALDAAAGGDLVKFMEEAIDTVTMVEVDKMLERVRPKDATRTKGPKKTG